MRPLTGANIEPESPVLVLRRHLERIEAVTYEVRSELGLATLRCLQAHCDGEPIGKVTRRTSYARARAQLRDRLVTRPETNSSQWRCVGPNVARADDWRGFAPPTYTPGAMNLAKTLAASAILGMLAAAACGGERASAQSPSGPAPDPAGKQGCGNHPGSSCAAMDAPSAGTGGAAPASSATTPKNR